MLLINLTNIIKGLFGLAFAYFDKYENVKYWLQMKEFKVEYANPTGNEIVLKFERYRNQFRSFCS